MMKYIKRAAAAVIFMACAAGAPTSAFADRVQMNLVYDGASHKYDEEEIKINIDGKEITGLDVPAVSINDRTMVPARAVFEEIGAEVAWNESAKEVYIITDSDVVTLRIDSNIGYVNAEQFVMDTPAKIVNDRTLIPVRAAAEALKYNVGWNGDTRTVTLSKDSISNNNTGNGNSANSGSQTGGNTASVSSIGVNSISVPSSSSMKFEICADGKIEKYESFMLDDTRLVVDIYNADMNVPNSKITNTACSFVTSVRTAQFQSEPEKIARTVFDLTAAVESDVSLSSDGKKIVVEFETNRISDVEVEKSGKAEIIKIYGDTAPTVNAELMGSPLRLVMDIPNAVSNLGSKISVSSSFISKMTSEQLDAGTVRITAQLEENIDYTVSQGKNYAEIRVVKSSLDNISYDESKNILRLDSIGKMASEDIEVFDDYNSGIYTIYLPDDYSDTYGTGTLFADNDEYISKLQVTVEKGKTCIKLSEKRSISVHIREYSDYIKIEITTPQISGEKIVVIDAGHGLQDNGASGNGLVEKDVNLDIAKRVYKLLEADDNIKVYATRLDDSYPTNINRAKLANSVGADLFVSIHQNSSTTSDPKGTEVLYAEHANETGGLTSKGAAQTLLKYVVNALDTENRGVKLRNDLIVLNQTTVPAVLIETCFISNPEDAAKMKSESYKNDLAEAIYAGIVDLLAQY